MCVPGKNGVGAVMELNGKNYVSKIKLSLCKYSGV